jgi:predicted nucleic acid-binding protein
MKWLLDTNILSELRRPQPEPRVTSFVADRPLELLWVSSVTLAEIRFGIELVVENGSAGSVGRLAHSENTANVWDADSSAR